MTSFALIQNCSRDGAIYLRAAVRTTVLNPCRHHRFLGLTSSCKFKLINNLNLFHLGQAPVRHICQVQSYIPSRGCSSPS
jgi:hypothetical protein